ncbi:MAG: hypothetical protein IPI67_16790 [Myxococcales bacterium]|nr:hypothetical protein [Myxococcales bacterium]
MTVYWHFPRSVRWALPLGVVCACVGCGDGAAAPGDDGTGGSAGATSGPSALAFTPAETLKLVPGDVQTLTVQASPPGHYAVRFALLGDAKDAALDQSEVTTDTAGRADVVVTAPSSATTFSVRASSGDKVSASLGASVSAFGFATLQVTPSYTGKRSISSWVASVRTGVTCAELSGDLLADGDLKGSAPAGQSPQVEDVPVGPALAVTLRGAESIAGCKDVSEVDAGEVKAVTVPVLDLPMNLDGAELDLVLGLEGAKEKWGALLGVDAVLAALSPASNDAAALLSGMQAKATDVAAFTAARKTAGWDGLVETTLGGPSALRTWVKPWLTQGAEGLASPDTFRGHLSSASGVSSKIWLSLEQVAGADAAAAGFPTQFLAAWQAHPDDSIALGVDLNLLPSRLLTALALGPAKAQVTGAGSVAEALAEVASCKKVAQTLVANGTAPGEAFNKCDASCCETLCEAAMNSLWQKASEASAEPLAPSASLVIAATANAIVDDLARPSSFSGTWVGNFSSGKNTEPVAGSASADKPPPPR